MTRPLLPFLLLALAATCAAQRVVRSNGAHGDAWSFDGQRILGYLNNDVCLWDATTGRLVHRMKGHGNFLHSVTMSPDGKLAASSSWAEMEGIRLDPKGTNTRVWELDTGKQVALLDDQVDPQFSPDGRRIVTFAVTKGREGRSTAEVWKAGTGQHVASLELDRYTSFNDSSLSFSPDGTRILFQTSNSLTVYDSSDGRRLGRHSQVTPGVVHAWIGARFADTHEQVATVAEDHVSVERLERYTTEGRKDLGDHRVGWVAWAADGSRAVAVSGKVLWIWDVARGKLQQTTMAVAFENAARIFVNPVADRGIVMHLPGREGFDHFSLIDTQRAKLIADYAPGTRAEFLGFSPDGATFLILQGTVRQYRSRDGALLREFVIEGVPTERPGEESAR